MRVNIGEYVDNEEDVRQIDVQIDKWDTWSLDHTPALIIYPALLKFKKDKTGVPSAFIPITDPYRDYTDEEYAQAQKAWDEVVDHMIWSFEQLASGQIEDNYEKEYHERVQQGLELFGKYYRNLWT